MDADLTASQFPHNRFGLGDGFFLGFFNGTGFRSAGRFHGPSVLMLHDVPVVL